MCAPVVSELDQSLTVGVNPAMKTRELETGVEMKAGQTLAIGGLVQNTVESQNSGLPWISEVPYLGVAFRHVEETINEVELLIMVTPELVEPMDANQVPPCGPGMQSASPSDWELFFKGHLEVPVCPPPCPPGVACATTPGNRRLPAARPAGRTSAHAGTRPGQCRASVPYNRYSAVHAERFAPGCAARRARNRAAVRRSHRVRLWKLNRPRGETPLLSENMLGFSGVDIPHRHRARAAPTRPTDVYS